MPQLPHSVELHDSELTGLKWEGNSIRIFLTPAYIHRDGKGWTQDVEIIIYEATIEGNKVDLPSSLDDGRMQTKLGPYHNLLNIPFAVDGPVQLELELLTGVKVTIKGKGIEHEFKGEPQFIEEFPST